MKIEVCGVSDRQGSRVAVFPAPPPHPASRGKVWGGGVSLIFKQVLHVLKALYLLNFFRFQRSCIRLGSIREAAREAAPYPMAPDRAAAGGFRAPS